MSEHTYYTICNQLSIAVVIIDAAGVVLFVNNEARKLKGLTENPIVPGQPIFDFADEPWRSLALKFFQDMIASRQSAPVDIAFTEDGKKKFLEVRCNIILDSGQNIDHIVVEGRDVTPQKIFETKITTIARELGSLIENANAVIMGTDTRGYITEWNQSAADHTGYSKNDAYTRKFFDLLLYNAIDHPFSEVLQRVIEGDVLTNYELVVKSKEHKRLTFLLNATPRKNAYGQVIGVLMIGQNITELSEYRQGLEQKVFERTQALESALQKEKRLVEIKNRFVSIASHEFKSPLSSISHHVHAIKKDANHHASEQILKRLGNIQDQVKHMSVLLEDVLTLEKNETIKMRPTISSVNLKSFLLKIIDEVRSGTNNSHEVDFEYLSPVETIQSDEKLLRNIFINLINNAIKFSPGQPRVFLSVKPTESGVEIDVIDRGIGIEEKDMERVFIPFNRGANVQQINGTGLGLSIVKKAVEILGGRISVTSKTGVGTKFTIRFNHTINNLD